MSEFSIKEDRTAVQCVEPPVFDNEFITDPQRDRKFHISHSRDSISLPPSSTRKFKAKALTIQSGDTAWGISIRYGLTLEDLQSLNAEQNLDSLFPGDSLLLPHDAEEIHPAFVSLTEEKAKLKGVSAGAKFFDVFPPPRDPDAYRVQHRALLNAMRLVESSFMMPAPAGDDGLSIGPLQISDDYHTDAWWLASHPCIYENCQTVEYSERTVVNYWLRWCPWALEFNDNETLARIHNGGPRYWRYIKTASYWRKVRSAMKRFERSKGFPELDPHLSSSRLHSHDGNLPLFQKHFPFSMPFIEPKPIDISSQLLSSSPDPNSGVPSDCQGMPDGSE